MSEPSPRPRALARVRAGVRFVPLLLALAVGGCGSDPDNDESRVPQQPPSPPPTSASATLTVTVDPAILPADGESTAMARATLTDARGLPQAGLPLVFTATLGDITWVTVDPDDPSNPFPTRCVAYTGSNGSAGCTFRAGFTPGNALIEVSSADLALSSSTALGVD